MTINSINNSTSFLTIDPGASGDSQILFEQIGSSLFALGVDDDDADSFVISASGALGTTNVLHMTTSGEQTLPLQPAFFATVDATINNVTGDGTVYTVSYDTENFDIGGNFSTTTFTAPIAGRYYLFVTVFISSIPSGSGFTTVIPSIVCSSAGTFSRVYNAVAGGAISASVGTFVELSASETVTSTIQVSGGTLTGDILGITALSHNATYFFGYLAT